MGAAVAPISNSLNKARKTSVKRADRQRDDVYRACTDLVRSAENLVVQVESNHTYHGPEMGTRLEQVRQLGADVNVYADKVAFLVPNELANTVNELASAARRVVATAAASTKREPDLAELNDGLEGFRKRAVEYFRR